MAATKYLKELITLLEKALVMYPKNMDVVATKREIEILKFSVWQIESKMMDKGLQ
jgi:hypothetical protein